MRTHDERNKQRRSLRLQDCDYSHAGAYYVTICTFERRCLFGEVRDGEMLLTRSGQIADEEWQRTALLRKNVKLDTYVIMPNHIHGVILILEERQEGTAAPCPYEPRFGNAVSNSLASIVGSYKSVVTRRINERRGAFQEPVWQRNYYEHVIRDEDDLNRVREYIVNNPICWGDDENNITMLRE